MVHSNQLLPSLSHRPPFLLLLRSLSFYFFPSLSLSLSLFENKVFSAINDNNDDQHIDVYNSPTRGFG